MFTHLTLWNHGSINTHVDFAYYGRRTVFSLGRAHWQYPKRYPSVCILCHVPLIRTSDECCLDSPSNIQVDELQDLLTQGLVFNKCLLLLTSPNPQLCKSSWQVKQEREKKKQWRSEISGQDSRQRIQGFLHMVFIIDVSIWNDKS